MITDVISTEDVGNLMCSVARQNTWRKGKRDFMQSSREIASINLTVRTKGLMWNLSTRDWRVGLTAVGFDPSSPFVPSGLVVFGSGTPSAEANTRLPHPTGGTSQWKHVQVGHKKWTNVKLPKTEYTTALYYYKVAALDFLVEDTDQFEIDWTILKLFSSEWNIESGA